MKNLPALRNENIVMQELDAEILLYDMSANQAHHLNETAAIVYRACGDKLSIEDLKQVSNLTDELIELSLDQMQQANLLAEKIDFINLLTGVNRREIIKRIALKSAVALPIISSIAAPTALNAASFVSASCGGNSSSPCPRIDCDECCNGGLYDIVVVNGCRTCRCLSM